MGLFDRWRGKKPVVEPGASVARDGRDEETTNPQLQVPDFVEVEDEREFAPAVREQKHKKFSLREAHEVALESVVGRHDFTGHNLEAIRGKLAAIDFDLHRKKLDEGQIGTLKDYFDTTKTLLVLDQIIEDYKTIGYVLVSDILQLPIAFNLRSTVNELVGKNAIDDPQKYLSDQAFRGLDLEQILERVRIIGYFCDSQFTSSDGQKIAQSVIRVIGLIKQAMASRENWQEEVEAEYMRYLTSKYGLKRAIRQALGLKVEPEPKAPAEPPQEVHHDRQSDVTWDILGLIHFDRGVFVDVEDFKGVRDQLNLLLAGQAHLQDKGIRFDLIQPLLGIVGKLEAGKGLNATERWTIREFGLGLEKAIEMISLDVSATH